MEIGPATFSTITFQCEILPVRDDFNENNSLHLRVGVLLIKLSATIYQSRCFFLRFKTKATEELGRSRQGRMELVFRCFSFLQHEDIFDSKEWRASSTGQNLMDRSSWSARNQKEELRKTTMASSLRYFLYSMEPRKPPNCVSVL